MYRWIRLGGLVMVLGAPVALRAQSLGEVIVSFGPQVLSWQELRAQTLRLQGYADVAPVAVPAVAVAAMPVVEPVTPQPAYTAGRELKLVAGAGGVWLGWPVRRPAAVFVLAAARNGGTAEGRFLLRARRLETDVVFGDAK